MKLLLVGGQPLLKRFASPVEMAEPANGAAASAGHPSFCPSGLSAVEDAASCASPVGITSLAACGGEEARLRPPVGLISSSDSASAVELSRSSPWSLPN
jgi:hypothetical protein